MSPEAARLSVDSTIAPELAAKEQRLRQVLESFDSVVVAFSGGVDSAYVAWAATQTLGSAALCVTAESASYPEHHRQLARGIARSHGLRHEVIHTAEMERLEYRANPVNRCYYCKHELYTRLSGLASSRGIAVVVDGNNADDRGDYRPGRQAAREFGVRSPLDEVDLSKQEIRDLSRAAGLSTWNEPASACLSSRIPYHSEVTDEKLRMIERAETVLRDLGFRVCRVRHHDLGRGEPGSRPEALARLEIGLDELPRLLDAGVRDRILHEVRGAGYQHVTIDLRGYRMGSLHEGVRLVPVPEST